jgi:hypothetical protein
MKCLIKFPLTVAIVAGALTACDNTSAQTEVSRTTQPGFRSAKEVRGTSPYVDIKNEPPPKLIVDPPLPNLLAQGVVWIQWRVENVHIAPVFGKSALDVTPRLGHLHIQVDSLPWWWADPSDVNTIDMAGLPPGPHKVKITLVNPNHQAFSGQSKTVTFTIPKSAKSSHFH